MISTTGIGSLPHHNIDAALEYSFRHTIPFLPQIPIRNPWEYMIPQALAAMPGLMVDRDGLASLNVEVWEGRTEKFAMQLDQAFKVMRFESFQPGSATSSSWQPFLWELEDRELKQAKVQIAGPITAQWALKLSSHQPMAHRPDIATQIYRLTAARALAMVQALIAVGVDKPILFLDEPALFALGDFTSHQAALAMSELRFVVQTLTREGARVGIHCCSDTRWDKIMDLGVDFVSFDVSISLESVFSNARAVEAYLNRGGQFSFGIVPTNRAAVHAFDTVLEKARALSDQNPLVARALREALLTPACGLALLSVPDADSVFAQLGEAINALK